jgi:hypothetical protein
LLTTLGIIRRDAVDSQVGRGDGAVTTPKQRKGTVAMSSRSVDIGDFCSLKTMEEIQKRQDSIFQYIIQKILIKTLTDAAQFESQSRPGLLELLLIAGGISRCIWTWTTRYLVQSHQQSLFLVISSLVNRCGPAMTGS